MLLRLYCLLFYGIYIDNAAAKIINQARRFKADPAKMASDVVVGGIDAAVHPFRTMSQASAAVTATYGALKGWYDFLKDPPVPEPDDT